MKTLLIVGTILALLIVGAFFLGQNDAVVEGPVACTLEARICPDGSAVGRTGPLCEFEACPEASEVIETESTVAALNERIFTDGVHITPLQVTEDSRCPIDVVCIQAGTVTLRAFVEVGEASDTVSISLGTPIKFGAWNIELVNVLPSASSVAAIASTDYRFEFRVY